MPRVKFVLYGKAPKGNEWYEDRCRNLRDGLGLKETVIFAGFAASAEAAYNGGDFAILSSISEGFPFSVVEAMLCGRTVVGTDVGGVSEALEGCGLVVEPRNPAQMAEACLLLLRNPELHRSTETRRAEGARTFQLCNSATRPILPHTKGWPPRRIAVDDWQLRRSPQRFLPSDCRRSRRDGPAPSGKVAVDEHVDVGPVATPGDASEYTGLDLLAEEVRRACAQPVNVLQIAALLESAGVTEAVARERYQHATVFDLADQVARLMPRTNGAPGGSPASCCVHRRSASGKR